MKQLYLYFLLIFCFIASSAQSVSITFEVNMAYQISEGKFNPTSDYVDVAGTFNSWGGTQKKLTDTENDQVYTLTISGFTTQSAIEFKFRINGQWDGKEEFPNGGPNRTHTVGSQNETLTYWYNDEQLASGPPVAGFSASSDFTYINGSIIFTEQASGSVNTYEWTFEGGNPATSSSQIVQVTYDEPGTYDVSLKVTGDEGEDILVMTDYITVSERSTDDLDWWNETVFYEIFVRSFYDSDGDGIGDFKGLTEKLDYLNDGDPNTSTDLGITGIWLMPINESPSYHGYDVNDYRTINPDYGTLADFKEFLDAAHDRGIKVIIDLVLNHTSSQNPWFKDAKSSKTSTHRNWYRFSDTKPGYTGPWGQDVWHSSSTGYYYGIFWSEMPDLNYDEPAVKEEIFDITSYWLADIGIDGFRLDAVKYIKEEGSVLEDLPATHAFWREWVATTKAANPNAFSIGEAWTGTDKIVPYVVNNGLDVCFEFDLASSIINGVKTGNASGMVSQINKVINRYPYYQFATFTTNHDMNRLMEELSGNETLNKLAAAIYLTLPGIPFIYYGEEIGMKGTKPDENIRRPMAWTSGSEAGFTTGNAWNDPASNFSTHNVNTELSQSGSLLRHYRKLVQLRSVNTALQTGSFELLTTGASGLLAYRRKLDEDAAYVLVNTSTSDQTLTLDFSDLIFDFEEPALVNALGTQRMSVIGKTQILVTIPAQTAQVWVPGELTGPEVLGIQSTSVLIYPNPASDQVLISTQGKFHYTLHTMDGRIVQKGEAEENGKLNITELSKGIYIIQIQTERGVLVRKIQKQ